MWSTAAARAGDRRYTVDRIEENVVILQNIDNGTIIELDKLNLPDDIRETDILVFDGNSYKKSEELTNSRIELMMEKMNNLREN